MSTDWLPVTQVKWDDFLNWDRHKIEVYENCYRIEDDAGYGAYFRKTKNNGTIYEEYGKAQCNDHLLRKEFRTVFNTDLISYIGEFNNHDEYTDVIHPTYDELFEREYG